MMENGILKMLRFLIFDLSSFIFVDSSEDERGNKRIALVVFKGDELNVKKSKRQDHCS